MAEYPVADTDEIKEGERIVVQIKGREVGIFNIGDEYYAYTNWCAHQGGPCTEGSLTGTMQADFDPESLDVRLEWSREEEILNCPWHGWEYDIKTGDCLSREKVRLPRHNVKVEDGEIFITVPG